MARALIVVVLFCLAGCAAPGAGPGAATVGPAAPVAGKSSLELVAEALQRGEIDEDTATLYRVFAVADDAKLPPSYRGALPIRDGATILRSARDRYRGLRPETRALLRPYLFPRGEP